MDNRNCTVLLSTSLLLFPSPRVGQWRALRRWSRTSWSRWVIHPSVSSWRCDARDARSSWSWRAARALSTWVWWSVPTVSLGRVGAFWTLSAMRLFGGTEWRLTITSRCSRRLLSCGWWDVWFVSNSATVRSWNVDACYVVTVWMQIRSCLWTCSVGCARAVTSFDHLYYFMFGLDGWA